MNVERHSFDDDDAEADARLDAAIEQARHDPRFAHLFEPWDEEAAIARGRADAAAGRVYDHEIVGRWLKTWGTPDRKPFHEWLAQSER